MTKSDLMKPALNSWQEVDETLGAYAKVQSDLAKIKAKGNAEIQRIKAEMEMKTADLEADERRLKQLMDIFVKFNMEEIREQNRKSITLTNGTVKTRTVPVFDYPDEAYLLEMLRAHDLLDCIKTEDKVLKSVLRAKINNDEGLMKELGIEKDEDTTIDYKVA